MGRDIEKPDTDAEDEADAARARPPLPEEALVEAPEAMTSGLLQDSDERTVEAAAPTADDDTIEHRTSEDATTPTGL